MSKSLKLASSGIALLFAASFALGAHAQSDGMSAEKPAAQAGTMPETASEESAADAAASSDASEKLSAANVSFDLGREAQDAEISAWDIDIRPDGQGLPQGSGTVAEGEEIFTNQCAACHGDFGEGRGRWPALSGGEDTLTDMRPEKTVGSYWPYLSTVYDYVHRAMPFGNAQSLSDDEVYAVTAYILFLNYIVEDEEFELSSENFSDITMPNEGGFKPDDRRAETHYADGETPCMSDCKDQPVEITMRAQVLDVTPDAGGDDENGAAGQVD